MESRWYLFPGQTLENTKISDRVHALHVNKKTWDGITKHLDRTKLLQEAADKEIAIKRYLNEGSKNMTKGWENSLENVRKRKEEERLRMIAQKKDDRQHKFLEIRKEQEEIRKKYMEKVKKQIFMTTGHARDLTSALVTAEVGFERQKQLEFQKIIKEHEKEEERKYAVAVKKAAEEERIEKEQEKRIEEEKKKKYGAMLKQTITEKQQFQKKLKEERVRNEALDNLEAVKEMEKYNELLTQDKIVKKKELFEEKKKYLNRQKELEQQRIKEENELDEVVDIYKEAKHRIDCMRKQREQEMRDAVLVRRAKITAMVAAEQQGKTEAEEKNIKKAVEEKDAAELEKLKAKLALHEKMKQDRLDNIREVQQKERENTQKELELKKWELLNRYKVDEYTQEYEDKKKKEMWQDVLRYRQELCEQMAENLEEQQREKAIDEASFTSKLEGEDAKFFEYAYEVMELAKKKGRSIVPIERVITKYIKQMNVNPNSFEINLDTNNPSESKNRELMKKLSKPPKKRNCRCYCPKK